MFRSEVSRRCEHFTIVRSRLPGIFFVPFVCSDSKSTIEEQTKHLYQELEKAHAELALLTSGKGDGHVSIGSHGSGSGSGSGNGKREGESEAYRTPTQRLLSMGLFEEVNSEHRTVPVSNSGEGVLSTTYRGLIGAAEGAPDSGSRKAVSFSHIEASCGGQVCAHEP